MIRWFSQQTLDARRDLRDIGRETGKQIATIFRSCFLGRHAPHGIEYSPLASRDTSTEVEMSPVSPPLPRSASSTCASSSSPSTPTISAQRRNQATTITTNTTAATKRRSAARYTQRLPFRRIFTRNVTLTLAAHSILAFHVGTFQSLWFVFLSTPVYDPAHPPAWPREMPFFFTGGMGLPPRSVGLAMAILGVFGLALQLLLYPALSARLGTVRSWRLALPFFPITYLLVPYLGQVASRSPPPHPKDGPLAWLAMAGVLLCQVVARTFALPAQTILVNNCTPHPSVLGTLHGLAQSVSSLSRTVGPMLCGYFYGLGLQRGMVGAVWWGLSGVAVCGFLASLLVHEGDGHEIWLDGDVED